jgi:hypothetical protein
MMTKILEILTFAGVAAVFGIAVLGVAYAQVISGTHHLQSSLIAGSKDQMGEIYRLSRKVFILGIVAGIWICIVPLWAILQLVFDR